MAALTFAFAPRFTDSIAGDLSAGTVTARPSLAASALELTDGSGAGLISWIYQDQFTIAASGTQVVDLYDFAAGLDILNQAIAAADVKHFELVLEPGAAATTVTVAPDASNGWTALLGASGSVTLGRTATKAGLLLRQEPNGLTVTDASTHRLLLTNNDATNSASLKLIVAGS